MTMKQKLLQAAVVEVVEDAVLSMIKHKIKTRPAEERDDAFFVADLGDVVHKYKLWKKLLPRVEPFYAVKCNDDPALLELLCKLGIGFDCASKSEIQKILKMKVAPSRIIYANPCKQVSFVKYAAKSEVDLMTFDNEVELHKLKDVFPEARLILRILPPDDTKAQCPLGLKFGCHPSNVAKLLQVAKELKLNVVGISFHVGSGCSDPNAYVEAVTMAREAFDLGLKEGFDMHILDIGGGFPGQKSANISMEDICRVLVPALDNQFPENSGVRIIAEPGRFFAASAFTLCVNLIAKRAVGAEQVQGYNSESGQKTFMYYVNDGVYGSFNCLLYDHATVEPSLIDPEQSADKPLYKCSIWGPTCDGLDCIKSECMLPELYAGNWLMFRDMGAYTMCAASSFNGMPKPQVDYVFDETYWTKYGETMDFGQVNVHMASGHCFSETHFDCMVLAEVEAMTT